MIANQLCRSKCATAVLALFSTWSLSSVPAQAQMQGMDMPMAVGHVDFSNSCSPAVKRDLDNGMAALYSFWFAESHQFFEKGAAKDPDCAIAYWGEAMSDYEQIEGGSLPEGEQLADGQRAIARGEAAPRKTAREKAYLDAVAIIFDASGIPDHDQRVQRFSVAMGALSAAYPSDRQAAVIYAMSLLKKGMPADPDLLRARKALEILNGVLKAEPDNPGVAHFIIHAADNPEMAFFGLDAARRYAKLAPAAPHALHMPGHIFARLGLWDEDIRSNLASKRAAEQPDLIHAEAQNRIHAMEFLQYAYLQTGQDAKAAAIANEAATVQMSDFGPGFRQYWQFKESLFPARQTLETGNWSAAMKIRPAQGVDVMARQVIYWTHAVAAGHLQDRQTAEQALAAYNATLSASDLETMTAHPNSQWAETKAWTLFAEGQAYAAIALLKPIADVQDKLGKGEVDLPAREMVADMLRLSGRSDDAIQQYRLSLQADPGRFSTLLHAAETAEKLHQDEEAAKYYRQLLKNSPHASPPAQQALTHASEFLARRRTFGMSQPSSRAILPQVRNSWGM
jgi:tetratricopeptide (TPR) repeat protein